MLVDYIMTTPQNKTKHDRPPDSTPPGMAKKNKDNLLQVCPVCDIIIVDKDESK